MGQTIIQNKVSEKIVDKEQSIGRRTRLRERIEIAIQVVGEGTVAEVEDALGHQASENTIRHTLEWMVEQNRVEVVGEKNRGSVGANADVYRFGGD